MELLPKQTKDALYHISLALLVGLLGGFAAIMFRQMINLNHTLFFEILLPILSFDLYGLDLGVILLPCIGGLLVGPLVAWAAIETKSHGIPEVMEAVNLYGGRIRPRVAFIKAIASSITLGSGGSAGREGPIAQISASLGSLVSQKLGVGERRTRLLVAAGMASGIGATFNAPLGGAIFAMEILLTEFDAISATSIILASVVGTAFAVYLPVPGLESFALGSNPSFIVEGLAFGHPLELFFYLLMGLAMGIFSILWMKVFYRTTDFFTSLPVSEKLKPGIGGFLAGAIGVFFMGYGILGSEYEGVNLALAGGLPLALLVLLFAGKIIATSLTVGSGGSGGLFAPTLYMGCMLGGVFGIAFNLISPQLAADPMAYALVGMGALIAGSAKAPLTFIIMIPEMLNDWLLLPPIMVACVASYLVSSLFTKESIYTSKLLKRGVVLDVDHILSEVRAGEVMTRRVDHVPSDMPVSDLINKMLEGGHTGYPVFEGDKLFGIITFDDIQGTDLASKVSDICTRDIFTLKESDSAQKAVRMLYEKDVGRLIVVDCKDPSRAVGIVSRSDIIKAYQRMIRKKKEW